MALGRALSKDAGALEVAKQLGGRLAPPRQLGVAGTAKKMVASLKK